MPERIQPTVSIIAALDKNRGIGKDGGIPWRIPGELKRFRDITMGHPIVMGRRTHESIGRTLPGRLNVVITSDEDYQADEGAVVAHSMEGALEIAGKEKGDEVFIIGGGQIYDQVLDKADRLYLTLLPGEYDADVFFLITRVLVEWLNGRKYRLAKDQTTNTNL